MRTKKDQRERCERLSLAVEAHLVEAIRAHQQRIEEQTGLRASLSQVACHLMRRGLAEQGAAART